MSSTRSLPAVAGGAHRMGCVTLSSLWAVSLCLRFLEVRRKPFNQAKMSPSLCFTVVDWASRLEKGSGNNAQRHCTFQIHHIWCVVHTHCAGSRISELHWRRARAEARNLKRSLVRLFAALDVVVHRRVVRRALCHTRYDLKHSKSLLHDHLAMRWQRSVCQWPLSRRVCRQAGR